MNYPGNVLTRWLPESLQFEKLYVGSFWNYSSAFIFKRPASGTGFQNTGFLLASAKLTVKYRPFSNLANTSHLATILQIHSCFSRSMKKCVLGGNFLEKVVILRFERRYPEENTVARLTSNILDCQISWPAKNFWAVCATVSLYGCITCQRCLRSTVTCGKTH